MVTASVGHPHGAVTVKSTTQAMVAHSLQILVVLTMVGQVVTVVAEGRSFVSGGRSPVKVREMVSVRVWGGLVGRVSWIVWARTVVVVLRGLSEQVSTVTM